MHLPSILTLGAYAFSGNLLQLPAKWISTTFSHVDSLSEDQQLVATLAAYSVLLEPGIFNDHVQKVEAYIKLQKSSSNIYFKDGFENPQFYLANFDTSIYAFVKAAEGVIEISKNEAKAPDEEWAIPRNASANFVSTVKRTDASWNLAMISMDQSADEWPEISPGGYLGGTDFGTTLDWRYESPTTAGKDVIIYVVDTGVRQDHPEVQGRVIELAIVDDPYIKINPDPTSDNEGHGTQVAAIAAGANIGVAKQASIVSIKVSDSEGTTRNLVIQGIHMALDYHMNKYKGRQAVMNLSRKINADPIYTMLFKRALDEGLHIVHSAGNSGKDKCATRIAPAGQITVGATNNEDDRSQLSNFGACVDIYAPGEQVVTAGIPAGVTLESGTSFAAPHVAGTVALLLAEYPGHTPEQVRARILERTRKTSGWNTKPELPFLQLRRLFN
ncbi:peptidase S8/S53 domain-containing protein [Flagelloscypha sp. PMI_526]|nr:peptidase S8/S53 domain-containing protein [Flagelloscypha sp. PMI_526]